MSKLSLNEQVARTQGYFPKECDENGDCSETHWYKAGEVAHYSWIPYDYSNDVAKAFELVEEMGGDFYNLRHNPEGTWTAEYEYGVESGKAPQVAICKVYIKWKENRKRTAIKRRVDPGAKTRVCHGITLFPDQDCYECEKIKMKRLKHT